MTDVCPRHLTVDDAAALTLLLATNPDYTRRVMGREPRAGDARSALIALPPAVDPAQKLGIGLWDGAVLVGYADVIRGWPAPDVAHIGLLMTHGGRRGQGLGRRVHEAVVAGMADHPEVTRLRIAIVDTNADRAEGFWSALGYTPTGETTPYSAGRVESVARIWMRDVRPAV